MANDEAPSKANQEAIKEKQSLLQKIQIIVGLIVTLSGLITGYLSFWANQNAEQARQNAEQAKHIADKLNQRFTRSQAIANEINRSLSILSGKDIEQARMALISLYSLATEEKEKFVIVNLAVASNRDDLKKTITELIVLTEDDPKFRDKLKNYRPLVETKKDAGNDVKLELQKQKNSKVDQDNVGGKLPPGDKSQILIDLTPSGIEGWIFLGKLKSGTQNQLESQTIDSTNIPEIKSIVKVKEGLNIRKEKPKEKYSLNTLGTIVGGLGKGSQVEILDVSTTPNVNGTTAIWANIKVPK